MLGTYYKGNYDVNIALVKEKCMAFCGTTEQDRQLQFNKILEKNIGKTSISWLNILEAGMTNLKSLPALVSVKE